LKLSFSSYIQMSSQNLRLAYTAFYNTGYRAHDTSWHNSS
jgi:hypothetical protein